MPITFQQPSPMSASTSIGAGRADVNEKEFSALAGLVESYGRLAAQAYGRGGGGGQRGSSGGGVQVLPTGDYSSTIETEQQANREQSADNLGFAASQDPVAKHIQMQEDYADRRQSQAMQANEQAKQAAMNSLLGPGNPQAVPGQPQGGQAQPQQAPTWDVQDDNDLAKAKQTLRKANEDIASGKLGDPDAADIIQNNAKDQINSLYQRKRAAGDYAQQQQQQQTSKAQELLVGQQDRLALESRKTMRSYAGDGMVAEKDPQTGKVLGRWQWSPKKGEMVFTKLDTGKAAAAKPEKEEKEVPISTMAREAEAEAKMNTTLTGDPKKDTPAIHAKAQELFAKRVDEQKQAREAKATAQRMKEADPQAVKAYSTFTAVIPRNDGGQLDLNRASLQQLRVLDQALDNPKRLGMTPADAATKKKVIAQAMQAKLNPPKPVQPIATPDPQSAMRNSANPQALVPNGGGFDLRSLWK